MREGWGEVLVLCQSIFDRWYSWMFDQLKIGGLALDFDSTVMTRYGLKQDGAVKGYNPKKSGRNSHHPLLAFVAVTQMAAKALSFASSNIRPPAGSRRIA